MTGILLAIVALFGWGIGDFFVQKAARKVGVAATLFAGGIFGVAVLTPFVYRQIGRAVGDPRMLFLLCAYGALGLFTALFSLEAYRKGKLAVVEPIMGLELPVTILLAVTFRGERLGIRELIPITFVFIGLLVTVTKRRLGGRLDVKSLERGVLLGIVGAIGLGASNFVTGVASQETSALLTVWFGRAAFLLVIGAYLLARGRMVPALHAMKDHAALLIGLSALYLVAFVSFAMSTTLAPISVVTAVSENYIVVAALLGVFVNKEKLSRRQMAGAAISVSGVLALAYLAS